MAATYVAHKKPLSRIQKLSESRGGSKVTKSIFSNTVVLCEGGVEGDSYYLRKYGKYNIVTKFGQRSLKRPELFLFVGPPGHAHHHLTQN